MIEAPVPVLNGPIIGTHIAETAKTTAAGDFDTFLTLLTAQLRNQDPLSPMEGTEFVAQLATFSSVEQLIGVNSRIDALNLTASGAAIGSLPEWIGKAVAVTDGSFRATGEPVRFVAPEAEPGRPVTAVITDRTGTEVRRLAAFPDQDGLGTWDGRDGEGRVVAPQDLFLMLEVGGGDSEADPIPGEVLTGILSIRGTESGVVVELADGRKVAAETIGRIQAPLPAAPG